MFRTDINHYLQLFDPTWWYWFMEVISAMGAVPFLTLIIYILIAGVNFKKGIGVANIFLYALILTLFLKEAIDYPRPLAVDTTLEHFGRSIGNDHLDLQPDGFWELFSNDLLVQIRSNDNARFGFPSGHTAFMVALTLGSALFFQRKWLWALSVSLVLLTMISRMYLSQHYLGDVLGGLMVSGATTLVIFAIWEKLKLSSASVITISQKIFLLFPVLLIAVSNYLQAFQLGALIGFNFAFLFIFRIWGMPVYSSRIWKRAGSVLIFFVLGYLIIVISKQFGLSKHGVIATLTYSLLSFTSFIISAGVCYKMKLWNK